MGMKIRGNAGRRLRCMRRVVEKLSRLLGEDAVKTAEQAHATLRFCGLHSRVKKIGEVPLDLEALLLQLADFIKVFQQHWDEVKADMSSYQNFFGDTTGTTRGTNGTV